MAVTVDHYITTLHAGCAGDVHQLIGRQGRAQTCAEQSTRCWGFVCRMFFDQGVDLCRSLRAEQISNQQSAARCAHAPGFAQEIDWIGNVMQDRVGANRIKTSIRKFQAFGIRHQKSNPLCVTGSGAVLGGDGQHVV